MKMLLLLVPLTIQGAVFDFEGLSGHAVPPSVELTWDNLYWLNGLNYDLEESGYRTGVVSGDNVAYTGFARAGTIASPYEFTLSSAYLTSAFWDQSPMTIQGFNNGSLSYTLTLSLGHEHPTLVEFNWANVDRVVFTPPSYDNLIMDDVSISFPNGFVHTPEPSAGVIVGLGLLGFLIYRKY